MQSIVTSQWKQPHASGEFTTGVSLHSHTSVSEETLGFVHSLVTALPGLKAVFELYRGRSARYGIVLDYARANWRPPLQPRMAYDLESRQVQRLGLSPLVSITDHDSIEAPLLLRTIPSSRHIPVSLEWSAPFGQTIFHLGIHNLPSRSGIEWMARLQRYTAEAHAATEAARSSEEMDARLLSMLRELHESPQVLIVFNHPLWDLHKVGSVHRREVSRFLRQAGRTVHAIELNGLRHVRENRDAAQLARETGHLLISGGDRHGLEPNANINLTCATSFNDFVEEIRIDRVSHVHFLPQYRGNWEQRILRSTLNAVTDFPEFLPGWQRWDERAFHPDQNGVMRPFAELWPEGHPPRLLQAAIQVVRLGTSRGLSAPLSLAFQGVNRLEHDLGAGMEWV